MDTQKLLEYFKSRLDAMLAAIADIVKIESPSYNVPQSKLVVEKIVGMFQALPLNIIVERETATDLGEHLIVRAFPSDRKGILLLGHTDTVHPVGAKEKNPTRMEDDNFYGCGIFDMKANIVLMAEAFRYFAETGMRPANP